MKYYTFILGCQQNQADSLILDNELKSLGFQRTSDADAHLIFVFACSVRQSAVNRVFSRLKRWQGKIIILTACVLPLDSKKLKGAGVLIYPTVELLQNLETILYALQIKSLTKSKKEIAATNKHSYITIQYGCDNFCTYCAVPLTRGREVSRSQKDILTEIRLKIKSGASELTLLGQNVNSFGLSLKQKQQNRERILSLKKQSSFAKLLWAIERIKGIKKLSFLSPNPQDMTPDVIDWMAKSKIFSKELNFPVQSGSNRILKLMKRFYTREQYLNQVAKVKNAVPDIWLSTDIIVGFPSETNQDFQNTVDLCQKAGFQNAFIAKYSPRPGTFSARHFKDDVPLLQKKKRFHILNQMINKQT